MAGRHRWKVFIALVLFLSLGMLALAGGYVWRSYKARKAVKALSWAMAGQTIVVDPGHGGIDAGAQGAQGTKEAELVLAISRQLAAFLRLGGAQVFLTRQDEEAPEGESGDDLVERVRLARRVGANLFISVHANAFDAREHGAQVFFNPASPQSEKLAVAIQEEIRRLLKNTDREALGLDAFVLRTQDIPAVIVEVGFLSNPQEEKLLNNPTYQRQMALAICAGIGKYLAGDT